MRFPAPSEATPNAFNRGNVAERLIGTRVAEDRVGYIAVDGTLVKAAEQWHQYVSSDLFEEKCCACQYLPLCMGGCRSARLKNQDTGSFCTLVPTNTTALLSQTARGGFGGLLRVKTEESRQKPHVDKSQC